MITILKIDKIGGNYMSEENLEEKKEEQEVQKSNDLDNTEKELEETVDRLKRVMAEFENYKKRNSKEREILYNNVLADIIAAFLPVVDNLEKACMTNTADENMKQGIELVVKQINDIFTRFGVENIETVGKPFDPEVHEAVSSVQDDSLGEKIVKEEFRKGYKIGTKIIRHAMVVVAN
jgi:molecular chaperone GrpE